VPKYSGKAIGRAGEVLRKSDIHTNDSEFDEAMRALSYWRLSHENPLVEAMSLVQKAIKPIDRQAVFAKRPKRSQSIINKLQRFDKMSLRTMNDIGGCRVILSNEKKLWKAVKSVKRHDSHFGLPANHSFNDYIQKPKSDGYRGYHLIGKFDGGQGGTRSIEIQFRTKFQHSWATSVEIVDIFTDQALKSNSGNKDWAAFFQNISKLLASIEKIKSKGNPSTNALQNLYFEAINDNKELKGAHQSVKRLAEKLNVRTLFEAFSGSLKVLQDRTPLASTKSRGYVLLEIDTSVKELSAKIFDSEDSAEAERLYSERELSSRGSPSIVVALVSSTSLGGIEEAYPNYFADASSFLNHLDLIMSITLVNPLLTRAMEYLTSAKLR